MRLIDGYARMLLDERLVLGREDLAGDIIGRVENGSRRLRLRRT